MKAFNVFAALCCMGILLLAACGCSTADTLAQGVSGKSLFVSGTVSYNRIGLDEVTQTPELASLFVWGDYTSVAPGDEVFHFEEVEDASIFNSSAVTKKRKVFFASADQVRMDRVLQKTLKAADREKTDQSDSDTVNGRK